MPLEIQSYLIILTQIMYTLLKFYAKNLLLISLAEGVCILYVLHTHKIFWMYTLKGQSHEIGEG